jgi:hypothetical protein
MKKDLQNCWEYTKCQKNMRENCEAYTEGYGKECWLIAKHNPKGRFAYPDSCFDCPWYKKNNPA